MSNPPVQSLDEVATNQASQLEQAQTPASSNGHQPTPDALKALIGQYEWGVTTLQSGKTFTIQSLMPGDYLDLIDSPLVNWLMPVPTSDEAEENASGQPEMGFAESLAMSNYYVIKGVLEFGGSPVVFAEKNQRDCVGIEVSTKTLTLDEINELAEKIEKLGNSASEVDEVQKFREKSETTETEADAVTHSPDGQSISPETESTPISEQPEESPVSIVD